MKRVSSVADTKFKTTYNGQQDALFATLRALRCQEGATCSFISRVSSSMTQSRVLYIYISIIIIIIIIVVVVVSVQQQTNHRKQIR